MWFGHSDTNKKTAAGLAKDVRIYIWNDQNGLDQEWFEHVQRKDSGYIGQMRLKTELPWM